MKEAPAASYDKENYKPFLNNKNKKLVKRSKIIAQLPKTIGNPKLIDIKSVTTEHPKTSRKLSKTIRQTKRVFQVRRTG